MTNAHLYVYNVGHGVCTLLIGDRDDGKKYCGVFDCGTKGTNENLPFSIALDDMVKKIRNIEHIDDIVISHQDKDHHSMLIDLIKKLNGIEGNKFGTKDECVWEMKQSALEYCKYSKSDDEYMYDENLFGNRVAKECSIKISDDKSYSINGCICLKSINKEFNFEIEKEDDEQGYSIMLTCYLNENGSWRGPGKTARRLFTGNNYEYEYEKVYEDIYQYVREFLENLRLSKSRTLSVMNRFKPFIQKVVSTEFIDTIKEKIEDNNLTALSVPIYNIVFGGAYKSSGYEYLNGLIGSIQCANKNNVLIGTGYMRLCESGIVVKKPFEYFANIAEHDKINSEDIAIKRNATSIVTQFLIDESHSVLFPGDATVHTFDKLKKQLKKPQEICMMIAPHHGSDHTNFLYKIKEQGKTVPDENQPLCDLLNSFNGCTIAVSSKNGDEHPGKLFMRNAIEYAYNNVEKHYIEGRSLDDATETLSNGDALREIDKAVYTNVSKERNLVYDFPLTGKIPQPVIEKKEYYKKSEIKDIPSDECFI